VIKDSLDEWDCKDLKDMLLNMKLRPSMYASCKEAYLMRVSTILEVLGDISFSSNDFYSKFLSKDGSLFLDLLDPVDQEWCNLVIDEALVIFNNIFSG